MSLYRALPARFERTRAQMLALVLCAVWLAGVAPANALEWDLRKVFAPTGLPTTIWKAEKPKKDTLKPVAFRIRAVKHGSVSRLEVSLTSKIKVDAFLLDNPDRVILDMPDMVFQLEEQRGKSSRRAKRRGSRRTSRKSRRKAISGYQSAGLIKSFRYGALGKNKSRIVIDLTAPAKITKVSTVKIASTVYRLRVDIANSGSEEFRTAAAKDRKEAIARNVASRPPVQGLTAKSSGIPVIVIDPGHGGIDSGARGAAGIKEKDIVTAFSAVLAKKLKETKKYKVILTRNKDIFVPLRERVEIARRAKAHLFISIHADSLSEKWVHGATVYTVSERASDSHAARLAEKENRADEKAGYEVPTEKVEISDILFDLTRRETRAFSHVFAGNLVTHWKKFTAMNKNPHRSGRFHVLKAPDVPSVLLELGYLSSKLDAALMTQDKWRGAAVKQVVTAINTFFEARNGRRAVGRSAKTAASSVKTKNTRKQ